MLITVEKVISVTVHVTLINTHLNVTEYGTLKLNKHNSTGLRFKFDSQV